MNVPVLAMYGEYDWIESLSDHQSIVDAFTLYRSRLDAFRKRDPVIAPGPVTIEILAWLAELGM